MQRYCQHAVFARIPFTASSIYPKAVAHPARRSPMNKLLCTNTRSSSYSTASNRHTADIIYRNNSLSRRKFSDITNSEYKSEYIHPLSQIVLEHLQSTHSDWVQRMGLDKGLQVKKDGTFVLRFDDGKMMLEGKDTVESIWTIYEPTEKKHYLCIAKNKLVGQYLLQDNTKPAWHTDKRSIPERVQDAVDEMVMKVDEMVVAKRSS